MATPADVHSDAMHSLAAAVMAMSQGDPSGLAVVVAAIAKPGARSSERKNCTLEVCDCPM
jgi:hypothetical protein